jgi:chromosome segregation ATPase
VCPVDPPEGNGKLLRYRLDRVEHKHKGLETATQFLAEKGAQNNEQIKVHDAQLAQLHEELRDVRNAAKEVAVLRSEVENLLDGWRAVRNAFLTAAGGLVLLASSIVWQATS